MDILDAIVLELPCANCGKTYEVRVTQVKESQDMLDEECLCRSETECPPMYLARLLEREDIELLQATWTKLERQARDAGAELIIRTYSHGVAPAK
jgi:hypothetical protein